VPTMKNVGRPTVHRRRSGNYASVRRGDQGIGPGIE
jgi:hypothetical protein